MRKWLSNGVRLAEDKLFEAIRGKKIALMVNGSAIHNDGRMLLDIIFEEKICDIFCLFGMEHGVRCNLEAGDKDSVAFDLKTGIPIVNLYDYPERRPPVEMLREVEAVVYCTQDAGVRHWTFTPWMLYLIDSAQEADCEVIIVDRPNPIGGEIVEGNLAEEQYCNALLTGFGYPLRHGMTVGELALMYREIRNYRLRLTVLKMHGWERRMFYSDTGLLWLPPTPNTPVPETFLDFATVGLLQSSNISLGDSTTAPFRFVGHPDFSGEALAAELNGRGLDDVYFAPRFLMAATRWERDIKLPCNGVMTVYRDKRKYLPVRAQLHLIDALIKLYGDNINLEYKPSWARKRMGTDDIYDLIDKGESVLTLLEKWQSHSEEFCRERRSFMLYR